MVLFLSSLLKQAAFIDNVHWVSFTIIKCRWCCCFCCVGSSSLLPNMCLYLSSNGSALDGNQIPVDVSLCSHSQST